MTGVILFRAQPFHNGHLKMIKDALRDCMNNLNANLLILVGSADKSGTIRNPLPIDLRIELITDALNRELSPEALRRISVIPLNDLTNERDNSHSWGQYLYDSMRYYSNDYQFTIYYSDRPEIMLSWFDYDLREFIFFRFLKRYQQISATYVRALIMEKNFIYAPVPWNKEKYMKTVYKYIKASQKEEKGL